MYKVRIVPKSTMGDWAGMNAFAAREVGFEHEVPENEVWISEEQSDKREVALHEIVEADLMRKKGFAYKEAHRLTNVIVHNLIKSKCANRRCPRWVAENSGAL